MSQNTVTMPDQLMEKLHCSICNGYLSCSPVRVLPDGSSICGQCTPPSNDSPIYRVQALEAILENVSFPCPFAQHGCAERLVFGQTMEHELKCEYRLFRCPSQGIACRWEGFMSKMLDHFTEAHTEQVVENADFKLKVDENSSGIILVSKENVLFIIKYQYAVVDNHLTYDIRFCKNDMVLGASYKLQLMNDSEREYNFNLKTTDCKIYNDNFYGVQNLLVLNLNKFLEALDNPNCILITINLEIRHNVASEKNINFELNLELLVTLQCSECRHYLIPPLFCLDKSIICCDCAKNNEDYYLPHNDNELLQLLNETNFPCRWRNCEFITKNNNLKKHELECQFRPYNCFMENCNSTFTLASAINHYTIHKCQYKEKELTFKTSFTECYRYYRIFTIKKHTIILLNIAVSPILRGFGNNSIKLYLNTSDAELTTGSIHFEHQHCKIKSKPFEIIRKKYLEITWGEVPPCFEEDDELTGVLVISAPRAVGWARKIGGPGGNVVSGVESPHKKNGWVCTYL